MAPIRPECPHAMDGFTTSTSLLERQCGTLRPTASANVARGFVGSPMVAVSWVAPRPTMCEQQTSMSKSHARHARSTTRFLQHPPNPASNTGPSLRPLCPAFAPPQTYAIDSHLRVWPPPFSTSGVVWPPAVAIMCSRPPPQALTCFCDPCSNPANL